MAAFNFNGNRVAHVFPSGAISSNGGFTAFEGNTNQVAIGYVNRPAKAGVAMGSALDANLYREAAGIIATGGGIHLGTPASSTAAGARLLSGSGAPGTITGAASGDFYFRSDTPTTANQRLYVYNGSA